MSYPWIKGPGQPAGLKQTWQVHCERCMDWERITCGPEVPYHRQWLKDFVEKHKECKK